MSGEVSTATSATVVDERDRAVARFLTALSRDFVLFPLNLIREDRQQKWLRIARETKTTDKLVFHTSLCLNTRISTPRYMRFVAQPYLSGGLHPFEVPRPNARFRFGNGQGSQRLLCLDLDKLFQLQKQDIASRLDRIRYRIRSRVPVSPLEEWMLSAGEDRLKLDPCLPTLNRAQVLQFVFATYWNNFCYVRSFDDVIEHYMDSGWMLSVIDVSDRTRPAS